MYSDNDELVMKETNELSELRDSYWTYRNDFGLSDRSARKAVMYRLEQGRYSVSRAKVGQMLLTLEVTE